MALQHTRTVASDTLGRLRCCSGMRFNALTIDMTTEKRDSIVRVPPHSSETDYNRINNTLYVSSHGVAVVET